MNMGSLVMTSSFDVFPPHTGGERRIYQIAREMAGHGRVIFVYPREKTGPAEDIPGMELVPYRIRCRYQKLLSVGMLHKTLRLCRREKTDMFYVHTIWGGLQAVLLRALTGAPFVLDEQNVEYLRFRDTGNRLWPIMKIYEKAVTGFAGLVVCVSERDKEAFIELGVPRERLYVAANGVDTSVFQPDEDARRRVRGQLGLENDPLVLFFGALDYPPSLQALAALRDHIVPRVREAEPGARFIVAGRNPPAGASYDGMEFVGFVERIQDYINASDVVVCPITSGGGTRTKILEAIACGKRVVSTTKGAEGLELDLVG